jgi:penicillin-binding protein 1A
MSSSSPSVPKNVRVRKLMDDLEEPPKKSKKDEARPAKGDADGSSPLRAKLLRWALRGALALVALALVGLLTFVLLIRHYSEGLPSVAELEAGYRPSQVTRVVARDGTLLAELFTERRTVVSIDAIPAHLKLAVLAAEDANFYNHEGVNYLGIARALVVNLRAGRTRQGGSTITQQVVKNLLLDSERTYRRKIREALLARRLEQELCPTCTPRQRKDKILELYLNHIYLGHGRYGIEEASRDNFGKSASELTVAEAAMLAGVPAGPEIYSPKRDLKRALSRREFVLDQMHAKGFLDDARYELAKVEPVRLAPTLEANSELAPEAVQIARRMLVELEPERGPRGGFTITTSIDPKLQAAARKALRENLEAYDKRHHLVAPLRMPKAAKKGKSPPKLPSAFEGTPSFETHKVYVGTVVSADDRRGTLDVKVGTIVGSVKLADHARYNPQKLAPSAFAEIGVRVRVSLLAPVPPVAAGEAKVPLRLELGPESALVALDVRTREVLALAGNYEAIAGGLDRATQSRRQPGSTFKPIVYSYALHSRRWTPASLVDPTPRPFAGGYKPTNYEGWAGAEQLRLREALANSVNIAAVHVLDDVGPANVVDWAQALGFTSTLKPDLSLALGSYEVHPIELVGAYATFASGGMYEEPRVVTKIVDPDGREVPLKPLPPARRVMEPAEAYMTTNMLQSVVDHGTGQRAKALGRPAAGKTGTSNAAKDTWFSGFTSDVACAVWVGFDDAKPLGGGESGASTALPAWVAFMQAAHEGKPRVELPRPEGIVTKRIDPVTGKLAYEGADNAIDEIFLTGTEPTDIAEPPVEAGAPLGPDGGVLAPLPAPGVLDGGTEDEP